MRANKKTLTTLAVAAGTALGGIAVAQTTMDTAPGAGIDTPATMQDQGMLQQGPAYPDTAATDLGTDTTLGLDEPIAQADRG